jgi:SAM-dependent methyltransferase
LPLPSKAFETIILSDVLEHIPEPANIWREMSRLLTPGGKVILNVPFFYQIHEEPFDFYRYTQFALRKFAEETGFETVVLEPIGGALECFVYLLGKLFSAAHLVPLTVASHTACAAFSRSTVGRSITRRTGEKLPLSYGMIAQKL